MTNPSFPYANLPCSVHQNITSTHICIHYQCNSRFICSSCLETHIKQHGNLSLLNLENYFTSWQKQQLSIQLRQSIAIREQFEFIAKKVKSSIQQQSLVLTESLQDLKQRICEYIDKFQQKQIQTLNTDSSSFLEAINVLVHQIKSRESILKKKFILFHQCSNSPLQKNANNQSDFYTFLSCKNSTLQTTTLNNNQDENRSPLLLQRDLSQISNNLNPPELQKNSSSDSSSNNNNQEQLSQDQSLNPQNLPQQLSDENNINCNMNIQKQPSPTIDSISSQQITETLQFYEEFTSEILPRFKRQLDSYMQDFDKSLCRQQNSSSEIQEKLKKIVRRPFKSLLNSKELEQQLLQIVKPQCSSQNFSLLQQQQASQVQIVILNKNISHINVSNNRKNSSNNNSNNTNISSSSPIQQPCCYQNFICKKSLNFQSPQSLETGNCKEIRQILYIRCPYTVIQSECIALAFNLDNTVKIVRIDSPSNQGGAEYCTLSSGIPASFVNSIFQISERNLAGAYSDGRIVIWDLGTKKIVKSWIAHKGPVLQLEQMLTRQEDYLSQQHIQNNNNKQQSKLSSLLISAGQEGIIRLWDLKSNKFQESLKRVILPANTGEQQQQQQGQGQVQQQQQQQQQNWNNIINGIIYNNNNNMNQINNNNSNMITLRFFSSQRQRIIILLQGNRFIILNADLFKITKMFKTSSDIVYWNVEPQTLNLITISGKFIRIWNIFSGTIQKETQLPNGLFNICTVADLQDGALLACINQTNEISFLNKFTLKMEASTKLGGKKGFHYICYLNNGRTVAVSSADGKIKLWNFDY